MDDLFAQDVEHRHYLTFVEQHHRPRIQRRIVDRPPRVRLAPRLFVQKPDLGEQLGGYGLPRALEHLHQAIVARRVGATHR